MARTALALQAVQRNDVAAANEQYTALKSLPGIMLLYVGTDRVLGLLSITIGRLDQAVAHFEDALAFCRRAGYDPELAQTCCDYADALLEREGPEDLEKAISLLDESMDISGKLGMRSLLRGVTDRLDRAKAQLDGTSAFPDGLTHREVEVLGLIAGGLSNSEIAQKLDLSVRTAERHITNIYAKINARSRTEATAYVFSHGWAS